MVRIPFAQSASKAAEMFTDRVTEVTRLIEHLESKGLRAKQTRLGEYLRFYSRYLAGACSSKEVEDTLFFVMREIDEWSWIYRGLTKFEPEGTLERMRQAVSGVAFAKDEGDDKLARSIQLELRVASYFIQTGFSISFSGLSDLVVDVDGYPVFVECKRLNSPKQVIKRAKEAARQLRARYRTTWKSSYGLVVFDASGIIHPKQGIVSGPTETIVRDGMRAQLKAFDQEHDTSEIFGRDEKLISVWMQAIAPGILRTTNEPFTRFSSLHSIYAQHGQRRWDLFERMKPAFDAS